MRRGEKAKSASTLAPEVIMAVGDDMRNTPGHDKYSSAAGLKWPCSVIYSMYPTAL
jgi:hypothetical protein